MLKPTFIFLAGLFISLFVTGPGFAQQQTARFIQMSEATKAFYEYLPEGYPAQGQKYPLLLFVHGYGEIGPGTTATLPLVLRNGVPKLINDGTFPSSFTVNNQVYKLIIISPQFTGFPSVNDINNSINYAIEHYAVDINRVYLTGLSMGGGAAWYYPGYHAYFASRIAATVPVCGATEATAGFANTIAAANLPVWATHNSGDPTVSVSVTNNFISLINGAAIPPTPLAKKTIFNSTTHDAWTQTYSPSFRENGLNIYEWMLQYSRNFMVLPVTGLEFAVGQAEGKKIKLQWKTGSEINNLGFAVLRSSDGLSFSSIGYVNSTAINGAGASYIFTDENPLPAKNYYRLEMNNAENLKNYSEIKTVHMPALLDLSFYPNPAQKVLNIKSAHSLNNARLRISNAGGQNVVQQTLEGNGTFSVPVATLPAGIYYGKIIENGEQLRFKFVKE